MLVVGTSSTFITRVLIGCLPGYNGVTQTPLWPGFTRSPCLNSTPLTSTWACAHEGNDHADVADGDLHHRHLFHLDEPGVQVPCAGQQDLLLQSAPSAAVQKRLRVLEVVVAGDGRPGNFARLDGLAIQRGDDAHHVRLDAFSCSCAGVHAMHPAPWPT